MTLLFMDGFDAKDTSTKWNTSQVPDYTTYAPRFGYGACLSNSISSGGGGPFTVGIAPSARVYFGFAYMAPTNLTAATLAAVFADGGVTEHLRISYTSAGGLTIGRTTTVLATSIAGVLIPGAWQYIEITATISDTIGIGEIRVNGAVVATVTGDTKNVGTSTNIDAVQVYLKGASVNAMDDFYLCNSLGSTNNTYLGDVRVQTLRPNAAGSSSQLTPVGSGSNYANVDESPPSQGDYNYSSTAGQKDLYNVEDLLGGTTAVLGVQVGTVARKTDTGARGIKNLVKSGATTTSSATTNLGVGANTTLTMFEQNPTTAAAWAVSDIPALEVGVEVV